MSWPSNMQIINPAAFINVADEWSKWQADPKTVSKTWRVFLNAWRKKGYVKNKYLYEIFDANGENVRYEDGGLYHPIEVFERQAGLKYRDRCPGCYGTGFVWAVAE